MADFTKFEAFSEHTAKGVHDLYNDTLKVFFTNTAPNVATHAVKADLAEIAGGSGYTAGGEDAQNTATRTGGTVTVAGVDIVVTATGGSIGPFRYAVLYNDTPAGAVVDPLIGYWDYGSPVTLADGEKFTTDFGASILTLS